MEVLKAAWQAEDECVMGSSLSWGRLTSYCLMIPYVCIGSRHLRVIFSSYVLPWMDSRGTAPGTEMQKNKY